MNRSAPRDRDVAAAPLGRERALDREDLTVDLLRLAAAVLTFAMAIVLMIAR
jgi:hypothetical protein